MQLIIMRHGQAESLTTTDAERNLTAKGRQDVDAMARRLAPLVLSPLRIVYSPYVRTTQTARIVGDYFSAEQLLDFQRDFFSDEGIISGVRLQSAIKWLAGMVDSLMISSESDTDRPLSLMLVSHQPLVSRLVGYLVYGAEGNALSHYPDVGMSPGSVAVLELEAVVKGTAQLNAMLHAAY